MWSASAKSGTEKPPLLQSVYKCFVASDWILSLFKASSFQVLFKMAASPTSNFLAFIYSRKETKMYLHGSHCTTRMARIVTRLTRMARTVTRMARSLACW